jgi:Ca-activated chloride channel homolog
MGSAGKIDFVRQGLATLIDSLADDDRLALVTYATTAAVAAPMGPVGGRRDALLATAQGLVAAGGTNLYAGLELGYQQVETVYDLERQNRLIMLSDGMPTSGTTDGEAILAMSAGYNAEGLGVTTVGLGTDFNALLMRGLAEQGHGNHYFLENSDAVQEVFVQELNYFTVPVAFDVTLAVQEGSHYGFGQAYGSSFWTDDPGGGSLEVPSVFLAHRISDDDVFEGDAGTPGRRGGGSALLVRLVPKSPTPPPQDNEAVVAIVDVSFREPGSTELVSDQVVVNHPHWQDGPPAVGHFDSPDPAITHKVLVMLELYRAIEFACATFHAGHGTDGLRALLRVQAAAVDYNDEIGDLDITYDLDLVQKLMDVMIANGAVPPEDPGIPADPWPAD